MGTTYLYNNLDFIFNKFRTFVNYKNLPIQIARAISAENEFYEMYLRSEKSKISNILIRVFHKAK